MDQANGGSKQKIVYLLLAFFIFAGIAGGSWWWYYTTHFVTTDDARISGTIINVSAKIPGRLAEVLVKEGQKVKKGQTLARIETREILAKKAEAQAALVAARAKYDEAVAGSRPQEIEQTRAALEQMKANFTNASKNFERMQKLYSDGAISSAIRDKAEADYLMAKEAVNAAEGKFNLVNEGARSETIRALFGMVKVAEAAVESVKATYDNAEIVAPIDGTVALKSINPGEVVAAGQPLFSITDLNDVWVNARIEETKIGKVNLNQKVEYSIDGYPGRTFTGTVYDIATAANSVFALIPTENASGNFTKITQRIPVKITLPKDDKVIFRPGMSVVVKIHVAE